LCRGTCDRDIERAVVVGVGEVNVANAVFDFIAVFAELNFLRDGKLESFFLVEDDDGVVGVAVTDDEVLF
jgi:hypothetical protein